MYIHPILSILISVLLVWMVTSFIVMYFHEWLASQLHWRSTMLETTIRNMLSDPALTDQLYNHPLIRSLYSGADGSSKPSYIAASQFAQALMDIVLSAPAEASLIQHFIYKLRWEFNRLPKKKRVDAQKRLNVIMALTRRTLVSQAGAATQQKGLDEIRVGLVDFATDFPELKSPIESMITTVAVQKIQIDEAIKSGLAERGEAPGNRYKNGLAALSITHPRLKQILGALLGELSNAEVETESAQLRARQNIEDWFNNSMDRLSGWYRRRAQTMAYILSITLVVLCNIDTLYLSNILWRDAYTRESMAASAQALVQQNPGGVSELKPEQLLTFQLNQEWFYHLPIGWIGFPTALTAQTQAACTIQINQPSVSMGIPLFGQCYPILNAPAQNNISSWVLKIFGLLISGIAAAQGAPFWFDILKKVINVRMTGAIPGELGRAVG